MATNNRIKLAALIKNMPEEAIDNLYIELRKQYGLNLQKERPDCPYCYGKHIVKNGHKCGKQAYLCRECRKSFVSTTNTIMMNSHQSVEAWEIMINDTIAGESLDATAEKLEVSHACVFHMRHKFLVALQDINTEYNITLDDVTELDETFVLDSYKGKPLPENVDRKPRKHGEGAQHRGISSEYICICTGVERNGSAIAQSVNRAKPSSEELKIVFENHISENALALCDGLRSYQILQDTIGCTVKNVQSETNTNFFNLNAVNSFHSFIKERYRHYRGVATKYINRYNALFSLAFRQSADAISSILHLLLNVSALNRSITIHSIDRIDLLAV